MIRTQALRASVSVVLLFLFSLCSQLAHAQQVPCDNSGAESVIPTNGSGEPLMPKEIQDNAVLVKQLEDTRLKREAIKRCLGNDKPLINHVIDFDLYVEAWKEIKDPKPPLHIQDSVLWSFKEEGLVNLAAFGGEPQDTNGKITYPVTAQIQWTDVTLGPSFSAYAVQFLQDTSFESSRFPSAVHSWTTTSKEAISCGADRDPSLGGGTCFRDAKFGNETSFEGAKFGDWVFFVDTIFRGRASFGEAIFGDWASFRSVEFIGGAFFSKAAFSDGARFGGATFGDDTRFWGATFGDDTHFGGATFGDGASFNFATFGDEASFGRTVFRGDTRSGLINSSGAR